MSSGGTDDDGPARPAPKTVKPKTGKGSEGGGTGSGAGACNIVERTKINSPDRTVRATLRDNDILDVVYDPGPPKRLLARTSGGSTLGSITSPSMPQIIQCIISGYQYEAVVLTLSGGLVEVQVQPK
jgi:hypothetical protein